ncbi:uncharacterized protein BX664DRAFT_329758 [Halteromyces radiatus]|uniref:uncharacterized protein n=1 Tax=Halteromyces radiatus TaxID=101107 RepID=UPI00221F5D29|nr:uncharacterized protein BX664DRAFT_329758 [Halteromyces radiatus]KAI8093455.1 hypothetical protein BX664DRAFT_329758 [Halteromyces radiatus]
MSRFLTPTPSHSNRSFKSIKSYNTDDIWMAREECHHQADVAIDDWTACLKSIQSNSHEHTMKIAKQFTQVDGHAKHTLQALEKTSKTLDLLLNQKVAMLSTVSTLTEIQSNLGVEKLAKSHWLNPSP